MRVLHVFKTYLPDSFGGIERVIWSISKGTSGLGVDNHIFSLSDDPTLFDQPAIVDGHVSHKAKLDLYLASTGISFSAFAKFRSLAAEAELIHYHYPWPMMDLLHFAVNHRKPSIVTYHSDIVRQRVMSRLYAPLMHSFLGAVDHIVATSPNYATSSSILRRYSNKTSVVPIGLPERDIPSSFSVEQWRRRLPENFFLFVGAFRYYKGLQFLLDAARLTQLPTILVGVGQLDFPIPANVTLLDSILDADKEALLTLCRAFVFPSHLRSEAFGVALLEAARAGRALISTEIGTGTSYINLHEQTGLVVRPGDAEALGAAMQNLSTTPKLAEEMGSAARARFVTEFTVEKMAFSYLNIYERMMSRRYQ